MNDHIIGYPGPPPFIISVPQSHNNGTTPSPVMLQQNVGPQPTFMRCSGCNRPTKTRIKHKASLQTHMFAGLICFFGCWPCAVLPYVTRSCNTIEHYCLLCDSYLGSYNN